jgi:hypothetical protein
LFIVDRIRDMIKVKVSQKEIESLWQLLTLNL